MGDKAVGASRAKSNSTQPQRGLSGPLPDTPTAIRDAIADPAKFPAVLHSCVKETVQEVGAGPRFAALVESVSGRCAETVFSAAESPIEKLLLNSLILFYASFHPFGLTVMEPLHGEDAGAFLKTHSAGIDAMASWCDFYDSLDGDVRHRTFREFLLYIQSTDPEMPDDWIDRACYLHEFGDKLGLKTAFYLMPQGFLPAVKVDGKPIRIDAVIWVPSDPSVKIAIECDGFEHHGTKDAFITDRKRDRALTEAGYRVRRYSGTEIWNNALACGHDLFSYLQYTVKPTIKKPRKQTIPKSIQPRLREFVEHLRSITHRAEGDVRP